MHLTDKMIKSHEGWDETLYEVPPAEGQTRFHDFELPSALMHAIADLGFKYCTPIQAEILPSTLTGRDATGRAQTGTGKTTAFAIPILQLLSANKTYGKKRKIIIIQRLINLRVDKKYQSLLN